MNCAGAAAVVKKQQTHSGSCRKSVGPQHINFVGAAASLAHVNLSWTDSRRRASVRIQQQIKSVGPQHPWPVGSKLRRGCGESTGLSKI